MINMIMIKIKKKIGGGALFKIKIYMFSLIEGQYM
jgi:hypothetical protein